MKDDWIYLRHIAESIEDIERYTAAGLAAGVPVALALARVIRGALYGIQPYDPATMVTGAVILLVIAGLAAFIPARRAARVDPMAALRCE